MQPSGDEAVTSTWAYLLRDSDSFRCATQYGWRNRSIGDFQMPAFDTNWAFSR
jgi:hypothetical protein